MPQDHDGNTVLHLAVRFGAINIVQLSCNAQPFMQQAAAPSPPPPTAAAAPSHTEPADTVMGGTEPSLSDHQASAGLPTPTAGVSTPVAAAEQHMDAAGELSTAAGRVDGLVDAAPTRPVPADVGSGGGSSTGAEGGCKATESEQQRSARRLALQAQLCSRLCKSRNKEHQTPLHVAGIFGKTEAAAIIARAAPECVSLGDRRRRTAGGLAKMRGHTVSCSVLLTLHSKVFRSAQCRLPRLVTCKIAAAHWQGSHVCSHKRSRLKHAGSCCCKKKRTPKFYTHSHNVILRTLTLNPTISTLKSQLRTLPPSSLHPEPTLPCPPPHRL